MFDDYTKGSAPGVSLESFIDYVSQRVEEDPNEQYEFNDIKHCAFGGYLFYLGFEEKNYIVGPYTYRIWSEEKNNWDHYYLGELHQRLNIALVDQNRTWTALHSRLLNLP